MTENLAGRGEGLAGLVAQWREYAGKPMERNEKLSPRGQLAGVALTYGAQAVYEKCAEELETALEAAARLPSVGQAPASTPSKSFYDHVPPDRAAIEKNKAEEPHGERLRAELEDWLDRNGIVSMRLDTQNHCVSVDIAKLPPEIKSVLRLWGSIYVERAALATPSPQAVDDQSKAVHEFLHSPEAEEGFQRALANPVEAWYPCGAKASAGSKRSNDEN